MRSWIDEHMKITPETELIDLAYFAKYKPDIGFKFSLDGFHNNPITDHPVVGIYQLNPPATLYHSPNVITNEAILNSAFNWESPIISP
jgi:hypothetical protein